MEPALLELRDQFFRILDEGGDPPQVAHKVWTLFVEHPWYRQELQRAAHRLVWRRQWLRNLADDIQQDAMLRLGRRLQHTANLNVDRALAEQHFSGWLARIINRDCQQAARAMRAKKSTAIADLRLIAAVPSKVSHLANLLDLTEAIDRLPVECRKVVHLHMQNWSVRQITRILRTSKSDAGRLLQQAQSLVQVQDIGDKTGSRHRWRF
jgi:RNA polymerase sigma factor (sigma-70 family)